MVKKILLAAIVLTIGFIGYSSWGKNKPLSPIQLTETNQPMDNNVTATDLPLTSVVVENLDTPWGLVFLPDSKILITERKGTVRINSKVITTIPNVTEIGEGGLLGVELDPDFDSNHFVYFYYTYQSEGDQTLNRVVRMKFENNQLSKETIIVDKIAGASNHNGGRIKFGPDKNLYITTGDAQDPSRAQDKNSLSGKILRVVNDGEATVYSYGHRNPQGLAWDDGGQLYATEHGRSGIQSGLDEFNKIEEGKNYGWPDIEGDKTAANMETPIIHSGPTTTWAPAGMAFYKGSFYFGGLRGTTLYKVTLINGQPQLNEYFNGEFGRIRDVVLGPDNMLYITTSNLDGRGIPKPGDDKIIRVNPNKL